MSDTNNIHELIEKTIAPPGIQKKNRRSIFKTIGDVGAKIKKDALTAFNAHFPYVADEKKLEEHGQALLIPHLFHDSAEEYRNRVATASFFLSKAGERGYILSQLEAHFGNRYILSESFLNVYIKVLDISESDRQWVRQFLDELLNPVIRLTFGDWMKYIEQLPFTDKDEKCVRKIDSECFSCYRIFRNGTVLRNGYRGDMPILRNAGLLDVCSLHLIRTFEESWEMNTKNDVLLFDRIAHSLVEKISIADSDSKNIAMKDSDRLLIADWVSLSVTATATVTDIWHIADSCFCGKKYARFRDGRILHNGDKKRNSNVLIAL